MAKKTKQNGYTFLELLLVLSVLTLLTAIILPVGDKWIRSTSEEGALKALVAAIQNLQAYSMANNVYTKLEFKHTGSMYITTVPGKSEFTRIEFPDGMKLATTSNLKTVEFHPNGNIVNTGTLTLVTSSGITEIRFQFQRGRMIIYE